MRLAGSGQVDLPLTLLVTSLSRSGTGNRALQASRVERFGMNAFIECLQTKKNAVRHECCQTLVTMLQMVVSSDIMQGAGGDSFGARGCEHKRQWCVGSGLERAREGLCSLQAGQLYWPEASPQVGSSYTRWLPNHLHSNCILQSHLITTQNVIVLRTAWQCSHRCQLKVDGHPWVT